MQILTKVETPNQVDGFTEFVNTMPSFGDDALKTTEVFSTVLEEVLTEMQLLQQEQVLLANRLSKLEETTDQDQRERSMNDTLILTKLGELRNLAIVNADTRLQNETLLFEKKFLKDFVNRIEKHKFFEGPNSAYRGRDELYARQISYIVEGPFLFKFLSRD